jgi:uncharacterized delta-60 repeat protein
MKRGAQRGLRGSFDIRTKGRGHFRWPNVAEVLEPRRLFSLAFGSIDDSFGVMGHAIASTAGASNTPTVGQVVVGGSGDIYVEGNEGIARFTSAGELDTSYGTRGFASLPSAGKFIGEAVGPTGLLYVLTSGSTGTNLTRYTTSGTVDQTYGNAGTAQVSPPSGFAPAALSVQADGKVVVAGLANLLDLVVYRVNTDGTPDSTFANGGEFQAPNFANIPSLSESEGYSQVSVTGCSVNADGEVQVGGGLFIQRYYATTARFFVARLTVTGQLDPTYGTAGMSFLTYKDSSPDINFATKLIPTNFAANSSGVATVIDEFVDELGGQVVGIFSASGKTTLIEGGVPGGRGQTAAAVNASGQVVLLTSGALTLCRSDGTLENTWSVDIPGAQEASFEYPPLSVAIAANGDLIVADSPASSSSYELTGFSLAPEELPNATINAIAAAPSDAIDLAYHDSASDDLRFVQRLANEQWTSPITLDAGAGAGQSLAVATDPNSGSVVDVAYYDAKDDSLKVASSTDGGTTFSTQTIDGAGVGFGQPSIYINHRGLASVVFYDKKVHRLLLASQRRNQSWTTSTIDPSGDAASDPVLVPNPSGQLTVAYSDNRRGWLRWAAQSPNGTWQIEKAAAPAGGAEGISMASDSNGVPYIAYYDMTRRQLRVAQGSTAKGGAFTTGVVEKGSGTSTTIAAPSRSELYAQVEAFDSYTNGVASFRFLNAMTYGALLLNPAGKSNLSLAKGNGVELAAYLDSSTGDLTVSTFQ